MGQANSRGTHAERVAQAIERDSAERKRKGDAERAAVRADRERIAALPHRERASTMQRDLAYRRARVDMQMLMAATIGLAAGAMMPRREVRWPDGCETLESNK